MSTPRRATALAGLAASLVLAAGCTPDVPAGGPTTPTTPAPPGSPASPSGLPASPSPTVSESPDERDYTPPPRDGSPDPSTAGSLSGRSFPQRILGFTPMVTQPDEGEADPNGTFVQAVDGDQAGRDARAGCTADADAVWPRPRHALQASYQRDGAPGGGMALQFGNADDATTWYARYVEDVSGCPRGDDGSGYATLRVEPGTDWMAARRLVDGERWSEVTKRSDDTVLLIMVSDQHSASMDRLTTAAKKLPADS